MKTVIISTTREPLIKLSITGLCMRISREGSRLTLHPIPGKGDDLVLALGDQTSRVRQTLGVDLSYGLTVSRDRGDAVVHLRGVRAVWRDVE